MVTLESNQIASIHVPLLRYQYIVTRKGIKPISAGLGSAAQSLYQRAKITY